MKRLLSISAAVALAFSASAFAADAPPSGAMTPQQTKMGDCNKQATGKKGDDRKTFMKTCLSGGTPMAAPAGPMTQQEKMKKCNVDATGKKGDDRKTFMKTCLSA